MLDLFIKKKEREERGKDDYKKHEKKADANKKARNANHVY